MTEPIRRRRSLTQVGGEISLEGDRAEARLLAEALDVVPTAEADAPDRAHVHGFHAYPARTHPVTSRKLVETFTRPGATVLDPFCGSGTVLVEGMLAGRDAIGSDLNPIAVMLARAKTFPRTPAQTEALVLAARGVQDFADAKRKAKSGASRRLPQADVSSFLPHVLLELDSIRAGIAAAPPESRIDLQLVLSSILVKLSAKRGDTSDEQVEKRIAAGYAARHFVERTMELARRYDELAALLPTPRPKARVYQDDARKLRKVESSSVDAIVTSPPYVATYDYLTHHAMRLRWLDLDAKKLDADEIGARRHYERLSARAAHAAWSDELAALFRSLARVARPKAPLILLIADSAGGSGRQAFPLRADEIVAEVARKAAFVPIARASQARPHFHPPTAGAFRDGPRLEHALLLHRA